MWIDLNTSNHVAPSDIAEKCDTTVTKVPVENANINCADDSGKCLLLTSYSFKLSIVFFGTHVTDVSKYCIFSNGEHVILT